MKTMKSLMILLVALLLVFVIGNFGSLANRNRKESSMGSVGSSGNQQIYPLASPTPGKRSNDEANGIENRQARQDEQGEEDGNDPDMPAFAKGNIDEADYIRRREEYIARLRGWETDKPFDPSARSRAIQQMEEQEGQRSRKGTLLGRLESMLGLSPSAGPAWTELGPSPIPNGPTSPPNPVSGRVSAIEIDPIDPNKVYVGAAQGGVYRSLNGGVTWTQIFDGAQSLAIGSLTLDRANARLWVGTGEPSGSVDSFAGVGLYRIENVNTTADLFSPINPFRTYMDAGNNLRSVPAFNGRSISKILISPSDPATLLMGVAGGTMGLGGNPPFNGMVPPLALRGLYKLTNATAPASVSVTRIAVSPNAVAGGCFDIPCTGNRNVTDMIYDLSDPSGNTLVVWLNGIGMSGGNPVPNDGGVYRSTNVLSGSPTFTQTLVTTASSTGNARGIFAIAQKAPGPALIYVASGEPSTGGTLCNSSSNPGALRRSTDGGVIWSAELPGGGGFCATSSNNQCFYNIGIDLVPGATTATDKVLLGGSVRSGNCTRMEGTSLDGAATTFSNMDGGLHADTHVIKIAPSDSNIVYRGDDGGIWKSLDGGNNWSSLNNNTFRATQFQSIAVHPIDRNYTIGGTQDNGTEFLAPDGTTWINSDGGDGGYALIDQSSPDTTNVTAYHTYFNLSGSRVGFERATSTVSPGDPLWTMLFGCPGTSNGINCSDAVNFYAPMALGPGGSGNPNTVYFGSDRLYRSSDKGTTMSLVSQGPLVSGVPVSAIGISPQDDNYRIVGLNNGALFFTTTGSSTLTSLDPTGGGVIPDFYVARAVFDPTNKNTAYVSLGNYSGGTTASQSHVWKVTNLSTTPVLTGINGSGGNILPDVPVNGIAAPRCDYENTQGTMNFAAGETSKSFSVAIVDDSYAEGTETFTIGLNSPSGATLGAQSTATVTIIDNDVGNGPNPIDNTNFFVRQQYIDFLGREPDPPGFAGWVSAINNCSGDTTQCDRIHVSQLFFQSQEFQERGYFVYRFYPVAFGRKPDYGEFVPDLASVSGFLDANQLEASKVAFIAGFMVRPAFASMYNSLNNTQYVDTLLNTAGVTLSSRQAMIDGLNNSTLTRGQVLRQIVESTEVSTKYNHQAYAVMEYFGYLRRQPDAFYLQWIQVLDSTNDPRGMVTGFVTSQEYRNRFGP